MKYLKLCELYNQGKTELEFYGKQAKNFPKNYLPFPNTLLTLNCGENKLVELPDLPDSLISLYCNNNQLTELTKLPKSLRNLHCFMNQLTELPELPKCLEQLFCDGNPLTKLPKLPDTINSLIVGPEVINNVPFKFLIFTIYFKDNNEYNLTTKEKNKYVDYRLSLDQLEYKDLPDNYKTSYIKKKYADLEKMKEFDLL